MQVYFGAHGHADGVWLDADQLRYYDAERLRVLVYPGEIDSEGAKNGRKCGWYTRADAYLQDIRSHVRCDCRPAASNC